MTARLPAAVERSTLAAHLGAPLPLTPLVALLLLAALFFLAALAQMAWAFLSLVALAAAIVLRGPRWLCYLLLGAALLLLTARFVFLIANGPQDAQSDRDEAVEVAAAALWQGQNPWARTTPRGTPITTGPTSVLLALPSVRLFHRINELTFVFYAAFFASLLAGDLRQRNDTFPVLGLFFLLGFFGFQHTLYWSLDELYYGYAPLFLAWLLLRRHFPAAAGVCLALAVGVRASYAFPVFALLCWHVGRPDANARTVLRLGLGMLLGAILILAPLAWVVGADLLRHNPLTASGSLLAGAWPETNPLFHLLNLVSRTVGPAAASGLKILVALATIAWAAWRLRPHAPTHPFWHLCLGGFLADMLVYRGALFNDYALFFVIPAFLAIAFSAAPGR